jgi:glycosyltransferase involved in cell wall biosynthesis
VAIVAASADLIGGQSVEAVLLEKALREDGCEVSYVPVNPVLPRSLRWVRRFKAARTLVNLMFFLPTLRRLGGCDVVHVFSASYWSFLLAPAPAMMAGRLFSKRVVLHYHSGEAADHLANWGWAIHPFLRLPHTIVVPSSYLGEIFDEYGHPTCIIRNFIEPGAFPYRERTVLRPHLVSIRNFEPHYGVETVLHAFAVVRARFPEATLTIVGAGSEDRELRELAGTMGGGVQFLGQLKPDQIPSVLADADVFLNASVVDNQPLSILEAFAAGLPVVSTSTGAIAEMIRDRRTGLLVKANDPRAMAAAVCELLERQEWAGDLARRARSETERYVWSAVRCAWAKVYGSKALSQPRIGAMPSGSASFSGSDR